MSQEILPVISLATATLGQMVGRKPSGVVGVNRTESGWKLLVEVVEKESIPSSQDLMGLYEVLLDDDGNITQFHRTKLRRRSDALAD